MPASTSTDTLTEVLNHLIRFPSVSSDKATNAAVMDWVESQLADLPLTFRRHEHNGVPSLTAVTPAVKDPKNPKLWLAAHTDVVDGAPDLFEPKIKDGRLYGRGAYDMKSAIACYVKLFREIGPELAGYSLGLMLTGDEEMGGANGAGWLTDQGYLGQVVLLPDSLKPWQLEAGAKGIYQVRLTAQGKEAHGSRVWDGENAIELITGFVDELRQHTTTEPCGDPKHLHHTLNLGKIAGGRATNQVPEYAEGFLDIRVMPPTTIADVESWVKDAQLKFPAVQIELLAMAHPANLRTDGPVKRFTDMAEAATGHKIDHVFAHGGTDARFFAHHDVPVVTMSGLGGDPHSHHEWIDLEDLSAYYDVMRRFVDEIAG